MRRDPATLPLVAYTTASQVHTPGNLVRNMWRDLLASRGLGWRLFIRDIATLYRRSLLGVMWAFLPPLATGLVFIVLQQNKVVNIETPGIPYPAFVLIGTLLWQTFVDAINAPLKSVNAARHMLAKINFPREALIVSGFLQVAFNFLLKLIILVGVFLIFRLAVGWEALLALGAVLALMGLGIALGLLLVPLGSLYTDIGSGLGFLTQIWFFLTPVVYTPPKSFPYSLLATLNPVSPLLNGARDLATLGTLNDAGVFAAVVALSLLALIFAWVLYRVALPIIVERISA